MVINLSVEGLHPTTVSCLEAMQWLAQRHRFASILDMGCGDGMLSVMAVHWWQARVLAADISAQAVADAQAVIASRELDTQIQVVRSDCFTHAAIAQEAPYDLIIFNLLAEPVLRLAPEVKMHLGANGIAIVSGILAWLEPGVVRAYEGLGFRIIHRVTREPWRTLVCQIIS